MARWKDQRKKLKAFREPPVHIPKAISPDIPLHWQCGSEEELRALARAICLTEPNLFDSKGEVTAVFRAATDEKRGGFLCVERKGIYCLERVITPRLTALCELAFRINGCKGMRWIDMLGKPGEVQKAAIRVRVTCFPPSAHEKAEALLTLADWLEYTIHDPEKRARYGLPPANPVT